MDNKYFIASTLVLLVLIGVFVFMVSGQPIPSPEVTAMYLYDAMGTVD